MEPVSIDPEGKPGPEDIAEEFDAKLRERRGDFEGFYTLKDKVDTEALAATDNFRGQSGNSRAMREFLQKEIDSRQNLSKLGKGPGPGTEYKAPEQYGPYEDGVGPENFIRKVDDMPFSTRHAEDMLVGNMIAYNQATGEIEYKNYPFDDPLYNPGLRESNNIILGKKDDWYAQVEAWFAAVDGHIADAESTGISQGGAKAVAWIGRTFIGEPLRALRELQDADLSQPPSTTPGGTEAIQKVTNVAAQVGVLSAVAPAPKGALRTFGGREDAANLAKAGFPEAETAFDIAELLTKKGANEKTIRDVTRSLMEESGLGGMSKGKDGQWRLEIPDKDMALKVDFDKMKTGGYLDEIVDHPLYFAARPEAKDIPVIIQKIHPSMKNFRPSGGFDGENIQIVAQNGEQVLDILTHELSHFSAMKNKFPRGTDPAVVGEEAYMLNAGENTAISSQARRDASVEELLDRPPYKDELVPRNIQELESRPLKKAAGTGEASVPYTGQINKVIKAVDTDLVKTQREIDRITTFITEKRGPASTIAKREVRLEQLKTKLDQLKEIKADLGDVRSNPNRDPLDQRKRGAEIREPATSDLTPGSPKAFDDAIPQKRRSKIEKIDDKIASWQTIAENSPIESKKKQALREIEELVKDKEKILGK